ncbi:hypothetical protein BaRGS_00025383 [Batillaria attramentaria]|uniref:Uncharacterized protein n=1 Tax=Batillaria attramentaria TaxID=370345 RepID=A0ABD0K8Q1_9CAEN
MKPKIADCDGKNLEESHVIRVGRTQQFRFHTEGELAYALLIRYNPIRVCPSQTDRRTTHQGSLTDSSTPETASNTPVGAEITRVSSSESVTLECPHSGTSVAKVHGTAPDQAVPLFGECRNNHKNCSVCFLRACVTPLSLSPGRNSFEEKYVCGHSQHYNNIDYFQPEHTDALTNTVLLPAPAKTLVVFCQRSLGVVSGV